MKRLITGFVAVLFLGSLGYTALADDLKIGVIDLEHIARQSSQAVAIQEKLEQQRQTHQEELMAMQQTLQEDMDSLDSEGIAMASSSRFELENKIRQQQLKLQLTEQFQREVLNLVQNQEMQQLLIHVKEKVDIIAQEQGYDLVMQTDAVPYASSELDITQTVIDELSK